MYAPSQEKTPRKVTAQTAAERQGNNLKGLEDFRLENGSSQGQNLALTFFFVTNSLDTGLPVVW